MVTSDRVQGKGKSLQNNTERISGSRCSLRTQVKGRMFGQGRAARQLRKPFRR